jgi:hypothetical protein
MDLAAPHDEVLAQKDQANAAFLLHGYGLVLKVRVAWRNSQMKGRDQSRSVKVSQSQSNLVKVN